MIGRLIRLGGGSAAPAGRRPLAGTAVAAALLALAIGASSCSGGGGSGDEDSGGTGDTGATAQVATDGGGATTAGVTTTVPDVPDTYTGVTPEATVSAAPLKGASLEKASEKLQAGARTVADAVGSAGSLTEVWALSEGGDPQATVSRFRVDAASAASARFRDQFSVQMLTSAQAVATPRFVEVDGVTVAVSEGPTSAAAWFADDRAMLLVASGDDAAGRIESLVRTAIPLVADA